MTLNDDAATAAARRARPLTDNLDEGTNFVIRVLDWILSERSAARLNAGNPLTLVQYDFTPPRASSPGAPIDLNNNGALQGAVHICAESLRPAHVFSGDTALVTLAAHQAEIVKRQLADRTSVSFDPQTGTIQVRLACVPHVGPIGMQLGGDLAPQWKGQELTPLPAAIGTFHAGLSREKGVGSLLFDQDRASARARIYYRNAMFLYLRYQLGLREPDGYRVTARTSEVAITHLESGQTSLVTAAVTRSGKASIAAAMIKRLIGAAMSAPSNANTFISCIGCPSTHPPGDECAAAPRVSLRHRHVQAS